MEISHRIHTGMVFGAPSSKVVASDARVRSAVMQSAHFDGSVVVRLMLELREHAAIAVVVVDG